MHIFDGFGRINVKRFCAVTVQLVTVVDASRLG